MWLQTLQGSRQRKLFTSIIVERRFLIIYNGLSYENSHTGLRFTLSLCMRQSVWAHVLLLSCFHRSQIEQQNWRVCVLHQYHFIVMRADRGVWLSTSRHSQQHLRGESPVTLGVDRSVFLKITRTSDAQYTDMLDIGLFQAHQHLIAWKQHKDVHSLPVNNI